MTRDEIVQKATFAYEDAQGPLSVEDRMRIALDAVRGDLIEDAVLSVLHPSATAQHSNIAAHTDFTPGKTYPAFVSINRKDNGNITIHMRGPEIPEGHVLVPGEVGYGFKVRCTNPGSEAVVTLTPSEYVTLLRTALSVK